MHSEQHRAQGCQLAVALHVTAVAVGLTIACGPSSFGRCMARGLFCSWRIASGCCASPKSCGAGRAGPADGNGCAAVFAWHWATVPAATVTDDEEAEDEGEEQHEQRVPEQVVAYACSPAPVGTRAQMRTHAHTHTRARTKTHALTAGNSAARYYIALKGRGS